MPESSSAILFSRSTATKFGTLATSTPLSVRSRSEELFPSICRGRERRSRCKSRSLNAQAKRADMDFTGFGEVAERLRRSTVVVRGGSRGGGSGVVCYADGLIVTNAHVLGGRRASIQLWDGRELEADIRQMDRSRDLAALQVSSQGLPAAVLADSTRVRAGELALAIGNPMGFVGALSTGVIHGVGPLPGLGAASWVQASLRKTCESFCKVAASASFASSFFEGTIRGS